MRLLDIVINALSNINKYLLIGVLAFISIVMHRPHFSKDLVSLHVWRQVETQTTILNFYEEDFNILNPRQNNRGDGDGIFRMEFPLMQWLVAGLYRVFGNHIIITRIFMFLTGLLAIFGMYALVLHLFNRKLPAVVAAWALNFSPAFYYYTINPLPDNFALSCSVWGLALFFLWVRRRKLSVLVLSGLLLSLGALTKLPFILFFIVPWTCLVTHGRRTGTPGLRLTFLLPVFLPVLLPAAWYASVIPHWSGNPIVSGILENRVSVITLLDYLQHNLVSTLPEVLLGYGSFAMFLAGLYFLFLNRAYRNEMFPAFLVWGLALIAYFLFEINAIGKVHDYYLFPFYPVLIILAGYGAEQLIHAKRKFLATLTLVLILSAPFTCYARMHARWDVESPGFNVNLLRYKKELREAVPGNALCIAGNDESYRIFLYYIDKKGWTFTGDRMDKTRMEEMIARGARFLYSDSRKVDEDPEIVPLLDQLVLEKGTIRIYRLRAVPEGKN